MYQRNQRTCDDAKCGKTYERGWQKKAEMGRETRREAGKLSKWKEVSEKKRDKDRVEEIQREQRERTDQQGEQFGQTAT